MTEKLTDEQRVMLEGWSTRWKGPGVPQAIVAALSTIDAQRDEIERLKATLQKISDIRDSIVGMQGFNFSEHAYPLVAALTEAGFEGKGYEISRKNLGTLIEQIEAADARNAALEAENAALRESAITGWESARTLAVACAPVRADGKRSATERAAEKALDALRKEGT
jgi:hypothetical protein